MNNRTDYGDRLKPCAWVLARTSKGELRLNGAVFPLRKTTATPTRAYVYVPILNSGFSAAAAVIVDAPSKPKEANGLQYVRRESLVMYRHETLTEEERKMIPLSARQLLKPLNRRTKAAVRRHG